MRTSLRHIGAGLLACLAWVAGATAAPIVLQQPPLASHQLTARATTLEYDRGPWFLIGRNPAATEHLLQMSDLVYQGAFRPPFGGAWGFSNGAITFDATGGGGAGTLYFAGFNDGANKGSVAEFTTPTPVVTSTLGSMSYAMQVQPDTDALEGLLFSCRGASLANSSNIRGLKVRGSDLVINCAAQYDDNRDQPGSFFVRPKDLSVTGQVTYPPYATDQPFQGYTAGFLADIPSTKQTALGGDTFTGLWSVSILTRESSGPAAFSFNIAAVGPTTIPTTKLLFYPDNHPLTPSLAWNAALSGAQGAVIPLGYDSVLFMGGLGVASVEYPFCYGNRTFDPLLHGTDDPMAPGVLLCYDPEEGSHGDHGYPYKAYYWLYRYSDLLKVKNGELQSYQIAPYDYGDLAQWIPTFDDLYKGKPGILGVAYDPATKRIFFTADKQNTSTGDDGGPLMHVFTHP